MTASKDTLPSEDDACSISSSSGGGGGSDQEDKIHDSSDQMSTSKGDTTNNSSSGNMEKVKNKISKAESRSVLKLRIIIMSILVFAAVAASVTVYLVTSSSEHEDFVSHYDGAASKIADTFELITVRLGAISSVAMAATIEGMDNIDTTRWPFVTMSSFQQRSATARIISDTEFVQILPFVRSSDRPAWERYVVGDAKKWIEEGLEYQAQMRLNEFEHNPPPLDEILMTNYTSTPIFYYNEDHEMVIEDATGQYLPRWQTSPVLKKKPINENLFRYDEVDRYAKLVLGTGDAVFGGFEYSEPGDYTSKNEKTAFFATLKSIQGGANASYNGEAFTSLFLPVFDNFEDNRTVVGVMKAIINWESYLIGILPNNANGISVVLRSSCGNTYTYLLNGPHVTELGLGVYHETKYNSYVRTASLDGVTIVDHTKTGMRLNSDGCFYHIEVYPTQPFYDLHNTSTPALITFAVAAVSLFTIVMFLIYDRLVEKRQTKVLNQAAASTMIVSSLFPKSIQERLMQQQEENNKRKNGGLKSLLNTDDINKAGGVAVNAGLMADFFPYCTVLFADIAGFTAWSSSREPSQVFVLLQTIFQGFDSIAKKRKVFKVESIGDCYMAVTGLPEPQPHHALIMSRFASECKQKMRKMTRELEVSLGPDTADLCLRIGLHSGAVIAGVLQGDRTRFQIFGDSVNIASKMEATGVRDKIHISQQTANLLMEAGKFHWVKIREDAADSKGKGLLKTYWLNPGAKRGSSASSSNGDSKSDSDGSLGESEDAIKPVADVRRERMVDWMVELLIDRIRKMVSARAQQGKTSPMDISYTAPAETICLDEVKEIIPMSEFSCTKSDVAVEKGIVPDDIVADLRTYVSQLASMYHNNPFHNFEHACHVTMSVNKLLMRIVTKEMKEDDLHSSSYTQSLCSDHLVAFAIVFSALIHDVDHRGCSNVQLIKEEPHLGSKYREKSVAEQNSLDLSWKILMEDRFSKLRSAIFADQDELLRFRQIIVNSVLATDIFDKELNDLRKARWVKAFSEEVDETEVEHLDRKATIVIEHIIQASDVSHTMQHWHVYRKWNTCLFKELYLAYKAGRMAVDPSTFWYKGELGFFDNYIIPLAGKLKDCNVFGVSSDEFLNYAVCNRAEWEERGQGVVEELVKDITQELADERDDEELEAAEAEAEGAKSATAA